MSHPSTHALPESLQQAARLDPALGRQLEQDFSRLLLAGEAMVWAQSLLPELLGAQGSAARLQVVVDHAREVTGVPGAWAVTWNRQPTGQKVSYAAIAGDGQAVPSPGELSNTVLGEVVEQGRPAWSDDALSDARFASSESVQAFGLRSVACVPLGSRGVLYLHDPKEPGRFSPEARARVTALCTLAAVVLWPPPVADAPAVELPGIVGRAPCMLELARGVHAFAVMPWPVLILGETGTGKEAIARSIHELSAVADGPFVPVNCGAIPEELAESVFFGHERGAFTGAQRQKDGLVTRARGGTLFLDEVGELSARLQVKLLRLLQEGTYEKVGGEQELRFTGRVVAATHRPLDRELGEFREDLFYRLAACILHSPPLRERRGDIPELAEHLLLRSTQSLPGRPSLEFSPEAVAMLSARPWPGNVRELENAIRGALARCIGSAGEVLQPHHFPRTGSAEAEESMDLAEATKRFQQERVQAALAASEGNRSNAAALLGVSRQWLHRLLTRWEAGG